jgi:hypothetical protein
MEQRIAAIRKFYLGGFDRLGKTYSSDSSNVLNYTAGK